MQARLNVQRCHAVRSALVLSLSLTGPALACAVKPGYMANGLLRTPAGVTSTCGAMYKLWRAGIGDGAKWAEMFFVTPGASARVNRAVDAVLKRNNYTLAGNEAFSEPPVSGRTLAYANLEKGNVLAMQRGKIGSQLFIAFLAPK